MIKLLIKLWKDERGVLGALLPAAITVGSSLLGSKNKGTSETETIDPYAAERAQLQKYLSGKIGTSTPYADNPAFNLDQPEVEKATESAILGGLNNLSQQKTDIQGIYGKYAEAEKASARAQQEIEMRKLGDRYNRLGLVSSTPGLQASTDLGRQQGLDLNLIDSRIGKEGVQAEMDATRLAEEIANAYMTQGQTLGSKQRGYQAYGKEMSMKDITRKTDEEQSWAEMLKGLIGQPSQIRTLGESNSLAGLLGGIGADVGSSALTSQLSKLFGG